MTNTMDGMQWAVIVTPLGSLIARADLHSIPRSGVVAAYDACTVIQRPSSVYVPSSCINGEFQMQAGEDPPVFSEAVAKGMSFTWLNPHTQEADELIEIDGPLVTDYIPVRPNEDIKETQINVISSSIVYYHPMDNHQEVQEYIDKIMGRAPTKSIDVTADMLADLDRISGTKPETDRGDSGEEGPELSLHGVN